MKKILLLLFLFLAGIINIHAQRIWSNPVGAYAYNPAGANVNDMGEILATYYTTYASANNSPRGMMLMGSTSFPWDNIGAGFRFTAEPSGVLKNLMGELTFVYKVNTGRNTKLAFGLSGVYSQMSLDNDLMRPQHADDPFLVQGAESGYWFDANFGINFQRANVFYIGAACYNMIGQQTSWLLPNYTARSSRLLSLSGMYSLNMLKGDLKAELSGVALCFVPCETFAPAYDLTLRAIIKKVAWVGGGITNRMAKVLAGVYIQNFSVGYAGCIGLGDLSAYTYSFPKHELFLRMEFDTSKSSKKNRKKTQ